MLAQALPASKLVWNQGALSVRQQANTSLLRIRVKVNRSSQNLSMLANVDCRAATKLRLQPAGEGLSAIVTACYLANLLKII
jgi:uncharacterized membrane-anchored protein